MDKIPDIYNTDNFNPNVDIIILNFIKGSCNEIKIMTL